MSLLVVGLSHHTAPIDLLERCALDESGARTLGVALLETAHVHEAVVLATCNRLEIIADVSAFHGGLADIGAALGRASALELTELTPHLFAHYADDAVRHVFTVTAGLDSMAVGEAQILGQVRSALRHGQADGTVGRVLDPLLQHSLRVGKRIHSETGMDQAGPSLVRTALDHTEAVVGPIGAARVLVLGAGAMSSLAVSTAAKAGALGITVANRTAGKARRLAESVDGESFGLEDVNRLHAELATADIVVSCTGALGYLLTPEQVATARGDTAGPQAFIDLALPRDVDPAVGSLPGVALISLVELRELLRTESAGLELAQAGVLLDEEVAKWSVAVREASVAPTVIALRSYADAVVAAELHRLLGRLPDLDPRTEDELRRTVRRVADKLLHNPTVRVKALTASSAGITGYADALRELFDLPVDLDADGSVDDALRKVPAIPGGDLSG